MADTYSNTSDKVSDTYHEGKHYNKYDNNFKKDSNALMHTHYMKVEDARERRGNAIMKKQKKAW